MKNEDENSVELTEGQKQAYKAILAGKNVFLSGSAGTGKSFVVAEILKQKKTSTIACAPTARAALGIEGTTVHKAFGLSVAPIVNPALVRIPRTISACSMVLIDEVSMVRRDIFDTVSSVIIRENERRAKGENTERKKPIQLVCVGDFCQLPPVIDENLAGALSEHYDISPELIDQNMFAFQSEFWDAWDFDMHYLTEVVRQKNKDFVRALNLARVGDPECIDWFNENTAAEADEGAVIIEGKNRHVDYFNNAKLDKLEGVERSYHGEIVGQTLKPLPAPEVLRLKVGARVMTTFNTGEFVNGEVGTVTELGNSWVGFKSDRGKEARVSPNTWEYYKYGVKKTSGLHSLTSQEIGTFKQLPLRLGWAVSIHKSQGQTYDAVQVDPLTWDAGMLYVALSRVRTLEKMHLTRPIQPEWLKVSPQVSEFYSHMKGSPFYAE